MPGLWRVADGEFVTNCYKIDVGGGLLSEVVNRTAVTTPSDSVLGFTDWNDGYKSWVLRGKGAAYQKGYLLGYDSKIETDQFCIDLRSAMITKEWPLIPCTTPTDCSTRWDWGTPTISVKAKGLVIGPAFHDEDTTSEGTLTIRCGGPQGQRITGTAVYTMVTTRQDQNRGQAIRASVDATFRSDVTFLNRKVDLLNSDPDGTTTVMVGVPGYKLGQRMSGAAILRRLTLDISRVTGSKVPVGFSIIFNSDPTP